ncbi:MAG TPA: cytochrome c family protein [Allosphingosinicella sp.]|nr:cytochrome c family protein [Allosphingosinicella sp.]
MDGRFNTIAGWVLGAGIVFLGANLVTHEIFKEERPEKMGYPINGVEEEGHGGAAAAERPIAFYLQTADAGRGERVFAKCSGCHNADQSGANGIGPNLWSTMGNAIAHRADYTYSDPVKNHGGRWDWETMNQWLLSPTDFIPGTKMTFNGLSSPQDRADVMLYLNNHGGTLTVPPPPAAEPAAGNQAAGNEAGANASAGNASAGNAAAPAANAAAPAH